MYTYKVMLKPNNKQRTRIRKTLNKCIECQNIIFDYLDGFLKRNEKIPSVFDVRKYFTLQKRIKDEEVKKQRESLTKKEQREKHLDTLFYDVSNDALKQTVKDTYNSFVRYFKKESKFPIRKSYKEYKKSFYVDPYKIKFDDAHVTLEKIATSQKANRQILNRIRLTEKKRIPIGVKYYNPRVVLEGERIWIVVSVEEAPKKKQEMKEVDGIGIDVNIHSINLSTGKKYISPINKNEVRRLAFSLRREQRKLSKQYLNAKENNKSLKNYSNYKKRKLRLRKKRNRIVNIMKDYHEKVINNIFINKPEYINIEDLSIKEMLTNRKLAKNIQMSAWRKFFTLLKERADKYLVEVKKVDRFFPSSKRCHKCGSIKEDLTLKDRIYHCKKCGNVIDRDYNAALNIKDYFEIIKD